MGTLTSLRSPRILITTDAVGGVWQYSITLARGLAAQDHQVLLVVVGAEPSSAQQVEAASIENVNLHIIRGALEWMDNPWDDVDRTGRQLLALEREFRPGIVHLNGYAHAVLPFSCPTVVVAHSCVLSWWRAVHGSQVPESWNEYRHRVSAALRHASAVVAPSQSMALALEREYEWPAAKTKIIWNGTVPPIAHSPKGDWCLVAGRFWDQAKNIGVLQDAAESLGSRIRLAGDGDVEDTSRLQFLGQLAHHDLLCEMDRAAVFAHPALYEPFGLSVLEAAGLGCALLLSDIPSLRELWDGAARFVPPRDRKTWAQALGELLDDRPAQRDLAQKARQRAGQYTAERSVAHYIELYRSLRERQQQESVAS